MSVILQTRDNKFYVVPRSLLSYWEVFDSLEEAVGNTDDVVPIPLTSVQTDVWLDLTVRMQVEWFTHKRTKDDVLPCLYKKDVETIVRIMDAKNTNWYLYCMIDEEESDEELKRWYAEVGQLHTGQYEMIFKLTDWFKQFYDELMHDYTKFRQEYIEYDDVIIFGILHNDLLRQSSTVDKFSWTHISWNEIIRFNLAEKLVDVVHATTDQMTDDIPQNILLLCYDGIHTPSVPSLGCFTMSVCHIVYADGDEEVQEFYRRTMRCAIAAMKAHPNDIDDIGIALNLIAGKYDASIYHLDLVMSINYNWCSNREALERTVGKEGVVLYKEAKKSYLEAGLKKLENW